MIKIKENTKIYQLSQLTETKNNIHESTFKSYHVLRHVETMLKRGDSIETILELIEFVYSTQCPKCRGTGYVHSGNTTSKCDCTYLK